MSPIKRGVSAESHNSTSSRASRDRAPDAASRLDEIFFEAVRTPARHSRGRTRTCWSAHVRRERPCRAVLASPSSHLRPPCRIRRTGESWSPCCMPVRSPRSNAAPTSVSGFLDTSRVEEFSSRQESPPGYRARGREGLPPLPIESGDRGDSELSEGRARPRDKRRLLQHDHGQDGLPFERIASIDGVGLPERVARGGEPRYPRTGAGGRAGPPTLPPTSPLGRCSWFVRASRSVRCGGRSTAKF
jgi:hypothetical protein